MEWNTFKRKEDEVLKHNISVAPNFSFPPEDFYGRLERELAARKVPGITISRVEYAEGGLLSDKRVYFRAIRERLAFDTCAASFGTEFFFSYRSVYSPPRVKLWHVLLVSLGLGVLYWALLKLLGATFAGIAIGAFIVALIWSFKSAVAANLADVDTAILKIPGLGPIYETWFRKDTYYRQDTRLIYLEIIPRIVQEIIDEITAEKGVKLVNQFERAPVLGELYKPKAKSP